MIRLRPPRVNKRIPGTGDDADARAILALYRRMHGDVAAGAERAIERWARGHNVAAIAAAVEAGTIDAVVGAIDFVSLGAALGGEMGEPIRRALEAGSEYALERFPAVVDVDFEFTDVEARRYLATHGADLVREVTNETRAAVRAVTTRGFDSGIGPSQMAREIRGTIGLTERQALAATNFRRTVERAVREGKSARWVVQRYGLARDVVRPSLRRMDRVESMARAYRQRFVAHRAQNIARTEVVRAVSQGRRTFYDRAIASGTRIETATWYTIGDDRTCQICDPMDGQEIAYGGSFTTPGGDAVAFPPAHPSCRCDWRVSIV